MAQKTSSTPATPPVQPTAIPMTTVHGFAIQVLGFIPIPKNDLRKQSEIPMLLLDIAEGRKTLDAIIPYIKGIEFRQQHVGKRYEVSEVQAWAKADADAAAAAKAVADAKAKAEAEATERSKLGPDGASKTGEGEDDGD